MTIDTGRRYRDETGRRALFSSAADNLHCRQYSSRQSEAEEKVVTVRYPELAGRRRKRASRSTETTRLTAHIRNVLLSPVIGR